MDLIVSLRTDTADRLYTAYSPCCSVSLKAASWDRCCTRGVQVKLRDPLRTRAIPEHLRGVFTPRRYTNPRLPLPYLCTLPSADLFQVFACHQVSLNMYADASVRLPMTQQGCPSFCMHCGHERLDEGQPSATEPIQDRGYVVGQLWSAARQDLHQKCVAVIDHRNATFALSWTVSCHWSYIAALCRSGYYQLQELRPVARSLSILTLPRH